LNLDYIDFIDVESMLSVESILNSFKDEAFDIESSLLIWILRWSRLIAINSSAQTVKSSQWKKNNRKICISSVANHENSVTTALSHKSYWVLFTKKVNLFIVKELNQWLFCVKIFMSCLRQDSNELQSAFEKLQLINEIMISALIQTFRLSLDVNDSFTQSTMWWKFWKSKERWRKNWSLSCNSQFNQSMMLNLNFQTFLNQYDLIWFLHDLIEWNCSLKFIFQVLQYLSLAHHNSFQISFIKVINIQAYLTYENQLAELFWEFLQKWHDHFIQSKEYKQVITEAFIINVNLMIQTYIQDIFNLLILQMTTDDDLSEFRINHQAHLIQFLTLLNAKKIFDLKNLSYDMITWLLKNQSWIAIFRSSTRKDKEQSWFNDTEMSLWLKKLHALFINDDYITISSVSIDENNSISFVTTSKLCKWHNALFWQLNQRLQLMIDRELSIAFINHYSLWIKSLVNLAASKLWIISHYSRKQLVMMQTSFHFHDAVNCIKIQNESCVQQIDWFLSQLKEELWINLHQVEFKIDMSNLFNQKTTKLFDDTLNFWKNVAT